MKMGYFDTHPFAKAGFFSIPLFVFIILMERFYPTVAPEGYKSFIIAFEFAKTPEQIHTLLQGLSPAILKNIDIANYIDFGFMFTYVSFLIFFTWIAFSTYKHYWLLIGIPISLVILGADFYENIVLFKITNMYSPSVNVAELDSTLRILHKMTWLKWGGLSLVFVLFSIKLLNKSLLASVEGMICIVPFVISFFALSNDPVIVSTFALSIFLVFFMLIMFSFMYDKTK